MIEPPQVAVAGEIFIDLIFSGFDEWPQLGKEIFAKEFHRELGGGSAITACALAGLGTTCGVLACVGVDTQQWVLQRLAELKVGSELFVDPSEPTAITVAATRPHDRAFLTYAGANRSFGAAFAEAVRSGRRLSTRHIHMAFPPDLDVAAELVERIQAQGCSVSLDVGWHEDWLTASRSIELLQKIDIFFPNETEAMLMTGMSNPKAILHWFADRNVQHVALKLGAQGAALLWDGERLFIPQHPVAQVDTTGAGDCFDAGFLHAWLRGQRPTDCLRMANICGAISTEALGGLNAIKSEHRRRMKMQKEDA